VTTSNEISGTTVTDEVVDKIVSATLGVDAHNHIDVPLVAAELPGPHIDLAGELRSSGLSAISMAFAVDYQELRYEGEAYERFLNGLSAMDEVLRRTDMTRATSTTDLRRAHDERQPIVVQSVEGAHFLEGHLDRLEIAYDRGLRHLTLLHDNDASVPLGDIFTNPAKFGGLTQFGAEVVRECNRLGILVDLSHGTDAMVNAALDVADRPVLISHTGLNTQLGTDDQLNSAMLPRLISKDQAKIVAAAGGVIGVWTHLAPTAVAYAQNIVAMAETVGVEATGIGTDTKLVPPANNPAGGHANRGKTVGTNGTWADEPRGFYFTVVAELLRLGASPEEISAIGGGNYLRVFAAATSA
jgi:membrane dipeptidase